jgi:hypothetical protein
MIQEDKEREKRMGDNKEEREEEIVEGEERSVERTGRQRRKERRLKKRKITRNRGLSEEVEIVRKREGRKKMKREQK